MKVKEQMTKTWSMLSQSQREQYEYIAQNLRNRHSKSKQITKYFNPSFNAYDLFNLDIMAHFMRRNREYQQYCPQQNMKSVISRNTMEQIFCEPALYAQCWRRFADYEDWLYFDFQTDFSELITIASIVELKHRIVRNDSRYSKEKNAAEVKKIGKMQFLQRLLSKDQYDESQKAFKYKFCELIFIHLGGFFNLKAHSIQSQISIKLSKIPSIPSVLQRSRQFLSIKYDYSVQLSSLKRQFDRLHQILPSQLRLTKEKKFIDESDLKNIQWRYLATHKLPDKFRSINNVASLQFCVFERLIMKKVCEIGLKRVKLLENVTNLQLKLEKECGRVPIFMLRYSFSYNELISKKLTADKNALKAQDLSIQVFVAFTEDQILTLSTSRQEFDFFFYGYFLRKLFRRLDQKRFVLVLYDFNGERRIVWQVYIQLCHYFKQMFDSHVYVSTNQAYFKKHLQLVEYIESCLMVNDFSAEDFHQFFQEIIRLIEDVFIAATKKPLKNQIMHTNI